VNVSQTDDLSICHHIRRVVFIQEQGISEADEMDNRDAEAAHFLIHQDGAPVGTARAFIEGETIKIGRVAVLQDCRGKGAGKALMQGVLDWAKARGLSSAKLDAQIAVVPFYERLSFVASGPEFDDAGIPHRYMERAL